MKALQSVNVPALGLDRPRCMGILNVTPDSFSDGGRFVDVERAVARGLALAEQGASVIDVGGESTRPGSQRTSGAVQRERVVEVIARLRAALDEQFSAVWISVDTTLSEVAEAALEAGASMVNDVSAGREDARMFEVAAKAGGAAMGGVGGVGVPMVLMHMQGQPATMQEAPRYDDVVSEVRDFLLQRARAAHAAGVNQVVIDPGIGFGKTLEHNVALLRRLDVLTATGYPVMLGTSRKGMIRELSPQTTREPADRIGGTCATTALAAAQGVRLFRVHDVRDNLQAAEVAWKLEGRGEPEP